MALSWLSRHILKSKPVLHQADADIQESRDKSYEMIHALPLTVREALSYWLDVCRFNEKMQKAKVETVSEMVSLDTGAWLNEKTMEKHIAVLEKEPRVGNRILEWAKSQFEVWNQWKQVQAGIMSDGGHMSDDVHGKEQKGNFPPKGEMGNLKSKSTCEFRFGLSEDPGFTVVRGGVDARLQRAFPCEHVSRPTSQFKSNKNKNKDKTQKTQKTAQGKKSNASQTSNVMRQRNSVFSTSVSPFVTVNASTWDGRVVDGHKLDAITVADNQFLRGATSAFTFTSASKKDEFEFGKDMNVDVVDQVAQLASGLRAYTQNIADVLGEDMAKVEELSMVVDEQVVQTKKVTEAIRDFARQTWGFTLFLWLVVVLSLMVFMMIMVFIKVKGKGVRG